MQIHESDGDIQVLIGFQGQTIPKLFYNMVCSAFSPNHSFELLYKLPKSLLYKPLTVKYIVHFCYSTLQLLSLTGSETCVPQYYV